MIAHACPLQAGYMYVMNEADGYPVVPNVKPEKDERIREDP